MLVDIETIGKQIEDGGRFFLAGSEETLRSLPSGRWIGGTIPYFMDEQGGTISKEKVYATELPTTVGDVQTVWYDQKRLPSIVSDAPENGFTFLIIPSGSQVHVDYAKNAPEYEGFFMKPVLGWIAGVYLDDLGRVTPKVFNGETGEASDSRAVAMHCSLPADKTASIGIVNLFRQGSGSAIRFRSDGFSARECLVDGKKTLLADYIRDNDIDTRLPLVADYAGVQVNVSVQNVNEESGNVDFYAPVFDQVEYRFADPVDDYVSTFEKALPKGIDPAFSCNCILNFLYSELEGKKTGSLTGPITFGEIAYQLLNQTLVYLEIV